MQDAPQESVAPILEEEKLVRWRDENTVYIRARKCRCNSVWCPSCSKLVWAKKTAMYMRTFDWKRTREITLTIDPGQFKDGKEAYDYVRKNKLIPRLMRNIQRGKKIRTGKYWVYEYSPVVIIKWLTFCEWHKNGFPHWHIIVETAKCGRFSMIGQDMIHHYWPVAKIIHEDFIKSSKHWDKKVGYFGKHGYFQDDKEHQTRLPEWALDIPGLRLRRSSQSNSKIQHSMADSLSIEDGKKDLILDPATGELMKPEDITYKHRFKSCGRCTFLTVYMKDREVDGLFNIPYREVRKNHPGQYREGTGYMFFMSGQEAKTLLSKMILGTERRYLKPSRLKEKKVIRHWCHMCGDRTYQKLKETKDNSDIYLCLRCKTVNEYRDREYKTWWH